MSLDLSNLVSVIKPLSGVIGGLLGGPVGATAAPVVIDALAKIFGVDATPGDVAEAIKNDPDAASKVAQVEAVHGATWQEMEARMLEAVNATAREELKSESAFIQYARPANIWVIALVTGGYGLCLVAATVSAVVFKDAAALNLLVTNSGVLGIALAPSGAVAGVSAWGRTKEKIAGVADVITGIGTVATKIAGRK